MKLVEFKTWSGFELVGRVLHTDWESGAYYIDAFHKDSGEEFGRVWVNIEECI
jgi:hypothetical protein